MNPSLDSAALAAVANRILAKTESTYESFVRRWHLRAERMFLWLMVAQWLFGIFIAVTVSPFAWEGKTRLVSNHVYAAVFLGGLLSALPIALIRCARGGSATRHVIAFSQVMCERNCHPSGPAAAFETHFQRLRLRSPPRLYRDWKWLVTATFTVAADHFVRGAVHSGVGGTASPRASSWRFLEHAGWVGLRGRVPRLRHRP